MPTGTCGGVRGGLISTYSIVFGGAYMRKLLLRGGCLFLILTLLFFAVSCEKGSDATLLMQEFRSGYGVGGVLYSYAVPEGERGYCDEEFFVRLYGETPDSVSDFAVLLLSGTRGVGECAVFVCYSDYDAVLVSDMCYRRIEFLMSLSGTVDVSFAEDAFVLRRGKKIVMCALADNDRARGIWKKLIQS